MSKRTVLGVMISVLIIGILGSVFSSKPALSSEVYSGGKAPDFTLTDIYGETFYLYNCSARVVLIEFFGTWCHACSSQIPALRNIYGNYSRDQLEMISISSEIEDVLLDFAEEHGIEWIAARDTIDLFDQYGVGAVPTLFIVDVQRYIQYEHVGLTEESTLRSEIESLLPKTIYVDDDNIAGPWDGTQEHPYQNITSALQHASDNDTIYVYNGTYYEHVVVNKTVSLIGEDRNNTIIDGDETGEPITIESKNVHASGFTMQNGKFSCILIWSNSNVLENNRIIGADYGTTSWGIYLSGSNNTVKANVVENCGHGIFVESSSYNEITENTIMSNHYGIWLKTVPHLPELPPPPPSSFNSIYHNNFIDNDVQVLDHGFANNWDNGFEGNYWSNYTGVDSNLDGIGDAPYVIDVSNQDNYPLMGSFTDFSATLEEKTYNVVTICNSTIIDFNYTPSTISFNVTGQEGTWGFCRITIPIVLLGKEPYEVLVDDLSIPYSLQSNGTHLFLYFTYSHSSHKIVIRGTVMLPVANFTWAPSMAKVGEPVIFDGSASMPNGGTLVGYEWDFGDGEYATGQIVTHTFSSADIYTVTLNVTDSEGLWDAEQKQIQVVQPYGPNAEFTATPETADIGESVKFDASASLPGWNGTHGMPITEYRWDFGGSINITASTPILYYSFISPGIYYVTLTVYAPGATPEMDSTTHKVTVISAPVGGYSIPIKGYTTEKPLTLYLALIGILTVSFTIVKRRKKQQS